MPVDEYRAISNTFLIKSIKSGIAKIISIERLMNDIYNQYDSDVITEDTIDVKEPRAYVVVLYNDNYTTMDFVVFVLETIFYHPRVMAEKIR